MAETDFEAGTLVRHRQWGTGEVIGKTEDSKVLVEFDQGLEMEFGLEVARRALRALPEGGLASLGRQDRDMLRHWARESVLRLTAAALVDLEQEAKSTKLPAGITNSDLRASIETSGAIDEAWAGWWKRETPRRSSPTLRRQPGPCLPFGFSQPKCGSMLGPSRLATSKASPGCSTPPQSSPVSRGVLPIRRSGQRVGVANRPTRRPCAVGTGGPSAARSSAAGRDLSD